MPERGNTMKISLDQVQELQNVAAADDARSILLNVYHSLQAKGYDPISQLVGYIISGDPTYITSYNQARSTICRLERDEIVEELVHFYIEEHEKTNR